MRPQATDPHPFESLTPDRIGDALESAGWAPDGRIMALNSYENRVYEVELEKDPSESTERRHAISQRRVVKFYRPARWSREQILEENGLSAQRITRDVVAQARDIVAGTKRCGSLDIMAFALEADVEQRAEVEAFVRRTHETWGRIVRSANIEKI